MVSTIIIISGASGLLGRPVYHSVKESFPNCSVVGLGFSRLSTGLRKCDLTSKADVEAIFSELQPKCFIHCAAERRPDVVEDPSSSAKDLNITATSLLAILCCKWKCTLIFISTDYVFDGTSPPYSEEICPNPLNTYGYQKYEAEKVVLAANPMNLVVRLPVLYGALDPHAGLSESAVTTLFSAVKNTSVPVKMDHVAIRFPTLTTDIAAILVKVVHEVLNENASVSGIFHISSDEPLTKYEMACRMANLFGFPLSHILADTESASKATTRRPVDAHLSCDRLKHLQLFIDMTPFDVGIKSCVALYV